MRTVASRTAVLAIVVSISILSLMSITYGASPFSDPFNDLGNWKPVSGNPQIDSSNISPNPPSLRMNSNVAGDFTFGEGSDSIYLENPRTTEFQDGTINFDIFFDNDPLVGDRAVITFRMLDSSTYYGAMLSNTHDWSSTFIVVKNGQVRAIGNASTPQAFPTRTWSRVTLLIKGYQFIALTNGQPVFSASDTSWSEGKWGGIGIYSAYLAGVFHIDNFGIENTSNPLTFLSPITSVVISIVTGFTTTIVTRNSTSFSVVVLTMNSTTTSPVVHAVVTDVYTTNYVPVFWPAPELSLFEQVAILLTGVCYGVFADTERYRKALELATVAGVAIIGLYVWNYQAQGLVILWPFFMGLAIGIILRVVRSATKNGSAV